MHKNEVRNFVQQHKDPAVKPKEVGEEFDCTSTTARKYLKRLVDDGDVIEKRVGSSALIYYPRELQGISIPTTTAQHP